jgi:hypothetical protein
MVFCSIALYGLILFYGLTKEELVGRRPLAKFLSIKLIVMFTFYQSFVVCLVISMTTQLCLVIHAVKFSLLTDHVIHGTEFWTSTNIADGLNALAICIEVRTSICKGSLHADGPIQMIFFSLFMMWAFPWKEYRVQPGESHTSIWRPLWDSINFCTSMLSFMVANASDFLTQGTLPSRSGPSCPTLEGVSPAGAPPPADPDYGQAFGVAGYSPADGKSRGGAYELPVARMSYDDDIRLTPYTASHSRGQSASPEENIDKPNDIETLPREV